MNMVCPECGLTRSFKTLPMRLQTCPRCDRDGADRYLAAPALEVRAPVPSLRTTELVRIESKRLSEGRTQIAS